MIHVFLFQWFIPAVAVFVGMLAMMAIVFSFILFVENLYMNDAPIWGLIRTIMFIVLIVSACLVSGHAAYVCFTRPGGF
jgi:hypothetical protein